MPTSDDEARRKRPGYYDPNAPHLIARWEPPQPIVVAAGETLHITWTIAQAWGVDRHEPPAAQPGEAPQVSVALRVEDE